MARKTFVLPFAPVLLAMVATPLAAGKVVRRSMVEAVTSLNTEKNETINKQHVPGPKWQKIAASTIAASNLSSWKFYHVGKTGGGTVSSRTWQLGLYLEQCHPSPCTNDDDMNAFITVRDPIDHFEGAFNWRCSVLCAPNEIPNFPIGKFRTPNEILRPQRNSALNESHRIPFVKREVKQEAKRQLTGETSGDTSGEFSEKYCHAIHYNESYILNVKYARNVSVLAESLCSVDEKIRKEAQDDLYEIGHLKIPQSKWISIMKQKERVVAFVLEPGFQFEQQIDAGLAWALNQEGVEASPEQFPQYAEDDHHHSSKSSESFPPLTEAATRCLAEHFREDYASLDWLRTNACHGIESQTCKAALKSIRDRRSVLLQ